MVLAEVLEPDRLGLAPAILARADVPTLDALARSAGMIGLWSRAVAAVDAGRTTPAEVRRVLGFSSIRPASGPGESA